MDRETKLFLGFMLGQLYRMQKHLGDGICRVGDGTIYGLLNGIESVVDAQLEELSGISAADVKAVEDVLSEYWEDSSKLENLRGFYDIERPLSARGVDRAKAAVIMRWLRHQGRFTEEIERMDSDHSPTELRHLEIDPDDL